MSEYNCLKAYAKIDHATLNCRPLRSWLLGLCIWLAMVFSAFPRPVLDNSDPVGFFTTVADEMLRNSTATWLSANPNLYVQTFSTAAPFGVTNIPVLVSNSFVYTPAVNRLLQLSANIYDASTNSPWPSVFRPLFYVVNQGGFNNVYINGYQQVASVNGAGDPQLATPTNAASLTAGTYTNQNVYGVPWIIGAKEGLPNFNQFSMLNAVQILRKLQVAKPSMVASLSQFQTNQMYVFSINNLLGCSLWNSYTSAYTGNLTVVAKDNLTVWLTNDAPGFSPLGFADLPIVSVIGTTNWLGTLWASSDPTVNIFGVGNNSFNIPLNLTNAFLPNAIYREAGYNGAANPYFDVSDTSYQQNVWTPPLRHFGLQTTNNLQVFILAFTNGVYYVIDYVHFAGPNTSLDINTNLADPDTVNPGSSGTPAYMWSTNGYNGGITPWGVVNQINVSLGSSALPPGETWTSVSNLPAGLPQTVAVEQAFFSGFFDTAQTHPGLFEYNGKLYTNSFLTMQVPYTPVRIITNSVNWQANDPLVHYLASDLDYNNGPAIGHLSTIDAISFNPWLELTNLTMPFSPWGQDYYSFSLAQNNGSNITYVPVGTANWLTTIKDPLMWRSDNWDFPSGQGLPLSTLGQIHRGTPWQTVYLKASDILASGTLGINTWMKWAGNINYFDATNSAPINDRFLMGLLIPMMNTNSPTQLMSVNDGNLTDWLNVLNGIVVLTNSGPDIGYVASPQFDSYVMSSSSAQALQIANAIAQAKANQPNHIFKSIGAILQTAALTENSPWLNWNDSIQQQFGISDEAYEAVPSQLLPLLRPDSVGAVVQNNGGWMVQFSGSDSYAYVLQTSTDLVNWISVSTNCPVQGSFNVPISPTFNSKNQFYRSGLLPIK